MIKAKKKMPRPANQDAWKKAHDRALAVIMDEANITSPRKGGLSLYGTNVLMNITNTMGALPSYNGKVTAYGDECENLSGEHVYDTILVDHPTCHACPVACKKEVELTEGPYKGLHMESVEYESAWALGANSGHHDINSVVKMIDQCNDYGMDTIELGNAFSTYMECSEKGYMNGDAHAGLGRLRPHGRAGRDDRPPRRRRRHAGRRPGALCRRHRPPGSQQHGQGPGHPGLRSARSQGHGHCLRHQQPRRLPSARLHARRPSSTSCRSSRSTATRWTGPTRAN